MANGTASSPTTLKGAIMSLNPKIVLAFILVIIAAALVVFFTIILTGGKTTLDAGTIALISSMITTFILMAKSASDYQFSSSSGSDKKDDVQADVSKSLADKVPTPPAAPITPHPAPTSVVTAWWTKLTDAEKNAITAAGPTDPRVAAFVAASTSGTATADDLAYLVSKQLLTPDRAYAIQGTA